MSFPSWYLLRLIFLYDRKESDIIIIIIIIIVYIAKHLTYCSSCAHSSVKTPDKSLK